MIWKTCDEKAGHESDKDMKDESVEDAMGEPDAEDEKDNCHEDKSDKDVEDESHEDAKRGYNGSRAESSTNPSPETDNMMTELNAIILKGYPWGDDPYYMATGESIHWSLREHDHHQNTDANEGKIGVKQQREEMDVEERSPRRRKLSSSGCTDATTRM
ncbi:hypothetical protein BDQ17DRAFT_1429801 [Cyathus striatus]|nr:hypothetical protein BDQ17DRAFT_1429801 [Cyathus striatus]